MPTNRTALPLSSQVCGGEYPSVEHILSEADGVVTALVNPASEMAYVEYDPNRTDPDILFGVLKRSGFAAKGPSDVPAITCCDHPDFPPSRSAGMKFDTKRFAFAVASAWAAWYAICYFFVAVAPEQTQAVLSFALHYDLTAVRNVSWAGFLGGLLLSTAWVAVFVATIGAFFNTRSRPEPSEVFGWKPATPK